MLLQPRGRGWGLLQARLPSTRAGGRQQSTPGARGSPRPAAPPGEGFPGRGERRAPAALHQRARQVRLLLFCCGLHKARGSTLPRGERSQDLGTNHGSTTAEMPTGPPRLSTGHKELKHCSNCFQLPWEASSPPRSQLQPAASFFDPWHPPEPTHTSSLVQTRRLVPPHAPCHALSILPAALVGRARLQGLTVEAAAALRGCRDRGSALFLGPSSVASSLTAPQARGRTGDFGPGPEVKEHTDANTQLSCRNLF